jgi:hypothetical protein
MAMHRSGMHVEHTVKPVRSYAFLLCGSALRNLRYCRRRLGNHGIRIHQAD